MSEDELDPSITKKVKELRSIVENANESVQQKSNEILSILVSSSVGFGYGRGLYRLLSDSRLHRAKYYPCV